MFSLLQKHADILPSVHLEHDGQERETIPPADGASSIDNYYLLNVNVKEANNVAGIFIPGLQVAQGTTLAFLFNPESDVFSLTLNSELIENEQFFVSNLKASARNQGDSISMFVTANDPAGQKTCTCPTFSGHRRGQREPGQPGHAVQQHRKRHLRDAQHHFALSVNPETGVLGRSKSTFILPRSRPATRPGESAPGRSSTTPRGSS